jgi:hypothetical protein
MLYHCYLRKGMVYVPTVAKMDVGFYRDTEPVSVVAAGESSDLRRALAQAIARGNPPMVSVPRPLQPPPILLKYAGVKTWSAFARGTSTWSISEEKGIWQIIGTRLERGGGWVDDPDQTITFPSGSGIDEVCDRMAAILQAKVGIGPS